jgi:ATP-binding cassette, subfamily B, bacterial
LFDLHKKFISPNFVFAWIWAYMRSHRQSIALLAALSMAEIGLRVLTPWPMQAIVDHALGSTPPPAWMDFGGRERTLLAIVAAGLLIQLTHHLVMMVHTQIQAAASQRMICELREQMFAHLQALALTHHAKMPKGDSVYRLESDAPCLDHLIFGGLFPLTFSVVTLVVMFSILVRVHVTLALLSIAVAPPMFLWLRIYTRRVAPRVDQTKKLESKVSQRLYESFSAIQLVKTFARETFERERFVGVAQQAMESNIELGRRESRFSVVIALFTVLGNVIVLGAGGVAVIRGSLTVGGLLVVIAYLGYVYGPLSAIAYTTGNLQRALASARRVRELLAIMPESPDIAPAGAVAPTQMAAGSVCFEDVSFEYEKGRAVLQHVSFTANPGETVALVGPSGAGKTTLVSLIPRFYELCAGRILIDGIDVRHYTLRALREQTSVVMQEALLLSGSVSDNLRYGRLDATAEEIQAAAAAANAHEFIKRMPGDYNADLGEAGAGLSGGQKQRLSIARAFLKNAPILILDEPTAALDTISEVLVLDALKRLRAGRTTFVIAHRLSTVREADRILVMDQGQIVGQGTDAELLQTCPLYRKLCQQLRETEAEGILEAAELARVF